MKEKIVQRIREEQHRRLRTETEPWSLTMEPKQNKNNYSAVTIFHARGRKSSVANKMLPLGLW